jgi:hypothetical protein
MAEWLTLLLRIWEVPGSNLDPETLCHDRGFREFSSLPSGEFRASSLKLGHDRFPPYPFQFIIIHLFNAVILVIEEAS